MLEKNQETTTPNGHKFGTDIPDGPGLGNMIANIIADAIHGWLRSRGGKTVDKGKKREKSN